ncbi:uncharacterized protein LOC113513747 [Galleria mellonella]|uniref:Uncharacterized protein LOC113513747 n=1 Tax=Galleria mellonella TaxID=7137 RepID=A0A6J1WPM7_GALME|nr:uncharacterized protein LOC113513747 [Galleria mellonella]
MIESIRIILVLTNEETKLIDITNTAWNILKIERKKNILIDSYSIFIGQEAKFETKSSLINSLFIMWVWFCVILRLVIQGDLTSGLQNTLLEPPMSSMEDAIKQVDGYGGGEIFKNMFKGTRLEKDYKIVSLDDTYIYLNNLVQGQRFILLTDKVAVNLVNIGTDFQFIGPTSFSIVACYYIRPGWPAAKRINNLIQRVIEVGFIIKATRENQHTNMLKLNITLETGTLHDPHMISCNNY